MIATPIANDAVVTMPMAASAPIWRRRAVQLRWFGLDRDLRQPSVLGEPIWNVKAPWTGWESAEITRQRPPIVVQEVANHYPSAFGDHSPRVGRAHAAGPAADQRHFTA